MPMEAGSSFVNPADCPAWNDAGRTLLGAAQEQWLDSALAQSGEVDQDLADGPTVGDMS